MQITHCGSDLYVNQQAPLYMDAYGKLAWPCMLVEIIWKLKLTSDELMDIYHTPRQLDELVTSGWNLSMYNWLPNLWLDAKMLFFRFTLNANPVDVSV